MQFKDIEKSDFDETNFNKIKLKLLTALNSFGEEGIDKLEDFCDDAGENIEFDKFLFENILDLDTSISKEFIKYLNLENKFNCELILKIIEKIYGKINIKNENEEINFDHNYNQEDIQCAMEDFLKKYIIENEKSEKGENLLKDLEKLKGLCGGFVFSFIAVQRDIDVNLKEGWKYINKYKKECHMHYWGAKPYTYLYKSRKDKMLYFIKEILHLHNFYRISRIKKSKNNL